MVAEVLLEGAERNAGDAVLSILAGHIHGKSMGEKKNDMTAPVRQTAAPVKMAMTELVMLAPAPGGGQPMQFVPPKGVTLEVPGVSRLRP